MVVISMVVIIFSIGFSGVKYFGKVKKEIERESMIYELENLIYYSQQYAVTNDSSVEINVFHSGKRVSLMNSSGDVLRNIAYDKDYVVTFNMGETIKINRTGIIQAGTITISERGIPMCRIKIRVGVEYINVEKA